MQRIAVVLLVSILFAPGAHAGDPVPLPPDVTPLRAIPWTTVDAIPSEARCKVVEDRVRERGVMTTHDKSVLVRCTDKDAAELLKKHRVIVQQAEFGVTADTSSTAAPTGGGAQLSFEATIINNFAALLAKRFQAEAIAILSQDLGKKLCLSPFYKKPLSDYFVESCQLLIDPDAAQQKTPSILKIGPLFQRAFYDDLGNFVPKVITNREVDINDNVRIAAAVIARSYIGIRRGETPLGILTGFSDDESVACDGSDSKKCVIQYFAVLAGAAMTNETWKTVELTDAAAVQKVVDAAEESLAQGVSERKNLKTWADSHIVSKRARLYIRAVLPPLQRLRDAVERDKSTSRDETQLRLNAVEVVTQSIAVWRNGLDAAAADNLCSDGERGRDRRCTWVDDQIRAADALAATFAALTNKDIPGFVQSFFPLSTALGLQHGILPADLRQKYVPLLVALVSAKNADELSTAFDMVEPISGDKTQQLPRTWKASFDGAVGGTVAWQSHQTESAVFAPVGIDVTYRPKPFEPSSSTEEGWKKTLHDFWRIKNNTIGVFVSVFDLGVATASRLSGNDTQQVDAKFADVFSPGAFLRWNVYRSIVLGAGGSLGPRVRDTTATANASTERRWRNQVFIGLDLPLVGLR